jgi:exonuclease III
VKSCNAEKIVIGNIYRPNSAPHANMDIFNEHLSEIIEKINHEGKKLIIMGDFNIDLLNSKTHCKTNDFVEGILSLGLVPLITKPTRIAEHSYTYTYKYHR